MLRCAQSRSRLTNPTSTAAAVLIRSIKQASSFSAINVDAEFLKSYKVTPPIKPWPQQLYPKRLVTMITRQQNLDLALQIFNYAGKYHPGFYHNYDTYESIIQKLSRARAFEAMESLLSELRHSQIKCGENLFITVIRNYGLAGKPKLSLQTFLRIEDFKVQRSVRSLNTLLNAFVQNKRYDLVHSMFKDCKDQYGVVPNVFTANILINALCKMNDMEAALQVFDEMPVMRMIPNVVTYTTILAGYVSKGDMEKAKKVLTDLFDKGWLPDATTYTILMDGYCRQGRLADAVKVMDDMEVEPNDVTYGVMIEAFSREKKSGEAYNLFDDMLKKNYVPSSALCCKVIDSLCEDGKVDDACGLWRRMLKRNCLPDNAILSTLIHWLCKAGKAWEARKLFDEFEIGSSPSLLTYNTLIAGMCGCGELGEAGKLWDDMLEKGHKANALTYSLLIKGFCEGGNVKEGIKILLEMLSDGCRPERSTYELLIGRLRELRMEGVVCNVVSMAIKRDGVDELFLKDSVCCREEEECCS